MIANADEKFNWGKARTLLELWVCSALGLVTGAADFCELQESTHIEMTLHVWVKGRRRKAFHTLGLETDL